MQLCRTSYNHPKSLKRYSLGTKNTNLKYSADGSLTLYAGAKSPGKDKGTNSLPAPNGKCSLHIHAYWADSAILDGKGKPPVIETSSRRFSSAYKRLQQAALTRSR